MEERKNSDAGAVALLKWIFAGLFLLNGTALLVAGKAQGVRDGLLGGFRWNFVAGLLCAMAGGLCWALSHGAIVRQEAEEDSSGRQPEQRGSRDRAIAFGALAIMLWVASLTTFVAGCGHLSWTPSERDQKPLHSVDGGHNRSA